MITIKLPYHIESIEDQEWLNQTIIQYNSMLRKLIIASLRNTPVDFKLFNYNFLDSWFKQSAAYDCKAIVKSLQACYDEIDSKLKEAQKDLTYYKSLTKKNKACQKIDQEA